MTIKTSFLEMAVFIIGDHMKDKEFIDISNISTEEFVEHMRELDRKSKCPCVGCEKCQIRMQRHECKEYQDWVRRYVTG